MLHTLNRPELGFGLGLRKEHYETILAEKPALDWFEIISENYLVDGVNLHDLFFALYGRDAAPRYRARPAGSGLPGAAHTPGRSPATSATAIPISPKRNSSASWRRRRTACCFWT